MKKHLFKKSLLVLIGVLITSLTTNVWAWDFWGGKDYYVDNFAVSWSSVKMKYNTSDDIVTFNNVEGTSYYTVHYDNNSIGFAGFTFFEGSTYSGRTKQSTYETGYDVHPSGYAVFVIKNEKTSSSEYKIGYFADPKQAIKNTRVYFDATPISGWGDNAYLRYGFDCVAHADAMTKFPGTANLFYIDVKQSYYTKYAIANNAGWTGGKTVAQPSDQCEPDDSYRITKSLAFSETDINNGYTVTTMVPTNKSATDHSCDWWNYNKNQGSDIPTQTVKIGSTALSHGAVRVSYYNTSGTSTTTDLRAANASITVPQSAIIQVNAVPDAGYYCTGITVGGSGYTAGEDYTVTATTTIAATFDYRWSIAGGNDSSPDAMGDWNINANVIANIGRNASSKDTGYVNISLPANTDFEFLIKDKGEDVWYKNGYKDSDPVYYMTYSSHTNWDFETTSKHNCGITTAGAGTYKFAWNITDKLLTVTYPTSYTVTFGYGTHGSSVTASGSSSGSITNGQYVTAGEDVEFSETHETGYSLKGWYTASSGGSAVSTMSSSDNTLNSIAGNANVYAQYNPATLTFNATSTSYWNNSANWSPACEPTIDHDVIIAKPVVVNSTSAVAKSVVIDQSSSNTGKLTINAGKKLVIANTLRKKNSGGSTVATESSDLILDSDGSNGNAALIIGSHDGTNQAQVNFYSISGGSKGANTSVNQYVGTPFSTDNNVHYNYYNSWMFEIARDGGIHWDGTHNVQTMNAFEGYCLIYNGSAGNVYELTGTLAATTDKSITLVNYDGTTAANNENVLANSWTAPIKISAMNTSGVFVGAEATIYIFNSGSPKQAETAGAGEAGNYTTTSVGTATTQVIPSMQSFSVYTTAGATHTLNLDYSAIVYDVAASAAITPNKAPKRSKADEMDLLKLRVQGTKGWADALKFYIHEDFSNEFENGWDAHKMYGAAEAPSLYAIDADGELAINCVPTADNQVVAFRAGTEDSEYTFSFEYDGIDDLYLKDNKLGIETKIADENTYTFTSETGDGEMRFIIIKKAPQIVTDVEDVINDQIGAQKILHNGALYIVRDGRIYNAEGALVK